MEINEKSLKAAKIQYSKILAEFNAAKPEDRAGIYVRLKEAFDRCNALERPFKSNAAGLYKRLLLYFAAALVLWFAGAPGWLMFAAYLLAGGLDLVYTDYKKRFTTYVTDPKKGSRKEGPLNR